VERRSSTATWAASRPTITLAMALQPRTGYVHSAYELTDLDEVAASREYLREQGYRHAWGLRISVRLLPDHSTRPHRPPSLNPRSSRMTLVTS
jgi:hypothetical protein